jgi:hypothetical protein
VARERIALSKNRRQPNDELGPDGKAEP